MAIEIACPQCRGHEIGETPPEKPFPYFRENKCDYCEGTGNVSLVKHYYVIGEHRLIKKLRRFLKVCSDFKKNKMQNESF